MVQPTPGDVHVNAPLTNISLAYLQDPSMFVARRVFPAIPVMKQSDKYFTYDRSFFWRDQMQKRAPSTESAGSGYSISTDTYFCDVWALHKDIDDRVRANADAPLNLDEDATRFLTEARLLRMENQFVTDYMATSVWSKDITGVSGTPSTDQVKQWNDAASTPIEDIREYRTYVHKLTGRRPNVLVLGQEVYDKLADHPDIVDRIKYSGGVGPDRPAKVTPQAMAQLFELDEIMVAGAVQNTAAEGATASYSFVVGKSALLCFRAPNPGLLTPSAGYVFEWNGYLGQQDGQRMKRFRMDAINSDRVEIEATFDMKVVGADLGVYFASIVA
jgi:hypothetical protein